MELLFEVENEVEPRRFASGGGDVAAFLSFVAMRGFGAIHPLISLADRLHDVHRIRLGPFTTFYEANPEDSEDRERLAQAWQPAGDLLATVSATLDALASDPMCRALVQRAGTPELEPGLGALRDVLSGLDPAHRVRLTYIL